MSEPLTSQGIKPPKSKLHANSKQTQFSKGTIMCSNQWIIWNWEICIFNKFNKSKRISMLHFCQLEDGWDEVEKNSQKKRVRKKSRHRQAYIEWNTGRGEGWAGSAGETVCPGVSTIWSFLSLCIEGIRVSSPTELFQRLTNLQASPFWTGNWVCFYLQTSKFNFKAKMPFSLHMKNFSPL